MNPVSLCCPLAPLKLLVTELVWRQIGQSSSAGRWLTGDFTMDTTCHHSAKQSTWRAWCQKDKAILPNGQFFLGWDNFWAMNMHPGVTLLFWLFISLCSHTQLTATRNDIQFHCLSIQWDSYRQREWVLVPQVFFFSNVLHSAATE